MKRHLRYARRHVGHDKGRSCSVCGLGLYSDIRPLGVKVCVCDWRACRSTRPTGRARSQTSRCFRGKLCGGLQPLIWP